MYYKDETIEIVNEFCYLGIVLNYNGKYQKTQKKLALQCRKAMFALKRKCNNMDFNYNTLLSLFDTYVASIAFYGCEIWGLHQAPDIEKVHLDFCKSILGVKRSTPNAMVYCELGRVPLLYCEYMNNANCQNWVSNVKNIFEEIGLNDLWYNNGSMDNKHIVYIVKQRLIDIYKQTVLADVNSSAKCIMYKHIVDKVILQPYLSKPISNYSKKLICKFRLSSHCLAIETGRYKNIPVERRKCPSSKTDIEDEFHFMLKCPTYQEFRVKFLKPYYYRRPSVF